MVPRSKLILTQALLTPERTILILIRATPIKMSGGQVIRATQMFTKHGKSTKVSLIKEIGIGFGLGIAFGLVWKTYHWNEKRKTEEYYDQLAALPDKQ